MVGENQQMQGNENEEEPILFKPESNFDFSGSMKTYLTTLSDGFGRMGFNGLADTFNEALKALESNDLYTAGNNLADAASQIEQLKEKLIGKDDEGNLVIKDIITYQAFEHLQQNLYMLSMAMMAGKDYEEFNLGYKKNNSMYKLKGELQSSIDRWIKKSSVSEIEGSLNISLLSQLNLNKSEDKKADAKKILYNEVLENFLKRYYYLSITNPHQAEIYLNLIKDKSGNYNIKKLINFAFLDPRDLNKSAEALKNSVLKKTVNVRGGLVIIGDTGILGNINRPYIPDLTRNDIEEARRRTLFIGETTFGMWYVNHGFINMYLPTIPEIPMGNVMMDANLRGRRTYTYGSADMTRLFFGNIPNYWGLGGSYRKDRNRTETEGVGFGKDENVEGGLYHKNKENKNINGEQAYSGVMTINKSIGSSSLNISQVRALIDFAKNVAYYFKQDKKLQKAKEQGLVQTAFTIQTGMMFHSILMKYFSENETERREFLAKINPAFSSYFGAGIERNQSDVKLLYMYYILGKTFEAWIGKGSRGASTAFRVNNVLLAVNAEAKDMNNIKTFDDFREKLRRTGEITFIYGHVDNQTSRVTGGVKVYIPASFGTKRNAGKIGVGVYGDWLKNLVGLNEFSIKYGKNNKRVYLSIAKVGEKYKIVLSDVTADRGKVYGSGFFSIKTNVGNFYSSYSNDEYTGFERVYVGLKTSKGSFGYSSTWGIDQEYYVDLLRKQWEEKYKKQTNENNTSGNQQGQGDTSNTSEDQQGNKSNNQGKENNNSKNDEKGEVIPENLEDYKKKHYSLVYIGSNTSIPFGFVGGFGKNKLFQGTIEIHLGNFMFKPVVSTNFKGSETYLLGVTIPLPISKKSNIRWVGGEVNNRTFLRGSSLYNPNFLENPYYVIDPNQGRYYGRIGIEIGDFKAYSEINLGKRGEPRRVAFGFVGNGFMAGYSYTQMQQRVERKGLIGWKTGNSQLSLNFTSTTYKQGITNSNMGNTNYKVGFGLTYQF